MYQRIYPADVCMYHHPCFYFCLDTPVQHKWIHTHHKIYITMTCKTYADSVSAIPRKSCVHFPSYFPLFQAVGNDPVPLCHVSHITAYAIAIFQMTMHLLLLPIPIYSQGLSPLFHLSIPLSHHL